MFRRHLALIVATVLTGLVASACVVRSEPRHRHGKSYRSAPPGHKKHKKHKKHRGKRRGHRHHYQDAPSDTWQDTSLRDESH